MQRGLRITAGVLGLVLALPLAIAAYGVAVVLGSDSTGSGMTTPVLAVTIGVGLLALVIFICAIRTLVRAYATRLTLFVLAGCELVALGLFIVAMRSGSNLVFYAVLAGVAVLVSVATGLRTGQRQPAT